ncbi:cupin domain-containing protein [Kaistia dalseonensis]|uniref:Uncharacterized protein YjlB n=1 Tax=Kaistia dalseonensis TaxID=410840 RepID=A0ABU0HBL4_9HYPH|nr:cupin domain-containing protein [Kaistia dalseonensis]MCX5497073.1 cupin domain-containing protein [Kaistia dalseonensis]MDQ0439699.1 uncharacterized protein YjlB [Kaistia dalseonensis]
MRVEGFSFADDGDVPNHPRWPLVVYAGAIDPGFLAASEHAFDRLFERNGWVVGFRNGIYPFTHFHSNTHEVLGIARGEATVQLGGEAGRAFIVKAGDALLLPAGTGHRLISSSRALLVIGGYPPGHDYDLIRSAAGDTGAIRARIAAVARPDADPVGGADGPMIALWT